MSQNDNLSELQSRLHAGAGGDPITAAALAEMANAKYEEACAILKNLEDNERRPRAVLSLKIRAHEHENRGLLHGPKGNGLDDTGAVDEARLVESYRGRTDPFLFPALGRAEIGIDRSQTLRRIKSRTASVNRHLKKIAARAGIERPEEVSSKVARHTFAERARKLGVAPHETGMTMRHSSTKETIGYQKEYDPDTVDAVLLAVWGTPE